MGTGATAKSVLVALVEMGVTTAWVQVRRSVRPDFAELAQALDVTLMLAGRDATPIVKVGYAVSTAPGGSEPASLAGFDLSDATVMDVAYGHGPSLWSGQCAEQGAIAIDGSRMLLHQAGEQVRLMTGFDAPLAAMDQALRAAQQGSRSCLGLRLWRSSLAYLACWRVFRWGVGCGESPIASPMKSPWRCLAPVGGLLQCWALSLRP
ncbi:hypothetical protein [Ornithinimicrobium sp. INDO-MA30-4]|uniref:hypothetical protein n=1 Tax=Ornithinimicrobium sp. INDO-MA30-4 TaxID=2908651 RepID=UPI001F42E94F|nr:hypothetical protein [Ornithinimicrobium sp. INDO-MA30-4]UJH70989.1 hypothetical protein L0A91_03355 [Ornithinimicrobium sp. INDO-MA30-4]